MRKPMMQELRCPKHRPGNDNWPGAKAARADRSLKSTAVSIMRMTIVTFGLACGSCLLGIGAVEILIRWM
jgi:hypothetical protein